MDGMTLGQNLIDSIIITAKTHRTGFHDTTVKLSAVLL